jgi:hypothetical protein
MEQREEERQYRESLAGPTGAASTFLAGLAIGSLVMYFLDPRAGASRRAVARDKVGSTSNRSVEQAGKRLRHLRNQVQGFFASSANWLQNTNPGDDTKIAGRIRSRLGRVTPYVHSVAVDVHGGVVTLSGRVPEPDIERVLSETRHVFGVREVIDHLARGEASGAAARAEGPQTQVAS